MRDGTEVGSLFDESPTHTLLVHPWTPMSRSGPFSTDIMIDEKLVFFSMFLMVCYILHNLYNIYVIYI